MIPDVHTTAADVSLRYVDLNRRINADYGWFGGRFQNIIDPTFGNAGVSDAYPGWFAFAAFASRGIGKAQLGAEIALDAVRFCHATGDAYAALARVLPHTHVGIAARLIGAFGFEEARLAATFLIGFASAVRHHGAFAGFNFPAMLDPRTLTASVHRLLDLLKTAPGASPLERLGSVSLTLRNAMEDGNRRIYGDIGGAAQDYLFFRESCSEGVTPERILREFYVGGVRGRIKRRRRTTSRSSTSETARCPSSSSGYSRRCSAMRVRWWLRRSRSTRKRDGQRIRSRRTGSWPSPTT